LNLCKQSMLQWLHTYMLSSHFHT